MVLMYLWDSIILRHFGEGHPTLYRHVQRMSWADIAIPTVVVAEVLRGRCEFALKAAPEKAALAHSLLVETQRFLNQFNVVLFNDECAKVLEELKRHHKAHKKYADMMIAAMAKVGKHIVVTRNLKDFYGLLPPNQLANWIDVEPT
jgi:predicted nucleic acid-binding protein